MAHQRERRHAPRSGVERRAMFVAVDGSTLLQAGVVTDMSRDGLHLRTRQPAPIGTVIEIEMDPRDGSPQSHPIITRGRVVRVQELPDGEYAVGVRLRYRLARPTPAPAVRSAPPAPTDLGAVRGSATRVVSFPRTDWRQWAFVAMLLIVVGVALLWPRQSSERATSAGDARRSASTLPEAIAEQIRRPGNPIGERVERGYSVQPLSPPRDSTERPRDRVSLHTSGAADTFPSVAPREES